MTSGWRWFSAVVLVGALSEFGLAFGQDGEGTGDRAARMTAVAGDHLDQTVRCEGHGVVITGSDSRLSVLGPCTEVRVVGSRNWLTVGSAQVIVARGNQNTVEYTERRTRVSDRGKGNTTAEKWPQ